MISLIIKKANGDHYWKESFSNKADCDKWLAEEQTRPYWDPNFQVTIDDRTAIEEARRLESIAQAQEKNRIRSELKEYLKNLDKAEKLPDLIDNLKKLAELL